METWKILLRELLVTNYDVCLQTNIFTGTVAIYLSSHLLFCSMYFGCVKKGFVTSPTGYIKETKNTHIKTFTKKIPLSMLILEYFTFM